MHTELAILRAMLRLQRRRAVIDEASLLVRVGGTEAELEIGLRALEAAGFIHIEGGQPRLSMAGLAVAIAQIPPVAAKRAAARGRRVARGRRAA
ncbi:MAG: hypothetical protein U0235_22880 [Polyangiaceae bacterium]